MGPIALACLIAAAVSANLGGSFAVFGTLAFTSIAIGLAVVTVRAMITTDVFSPVSRAPARAVEPTVDAGTSRSVEATTSPRSEALHQWSLEVLGGLEPQRFESVCAAYFRILGFRVTMRPNGPALGMDIRLHVAGAGRPPVNLVRCQAHDRPVGVNDIREFLDAMSDHRVPRGIFISLHGFRSSAQGLAEVNRIFVMSAEELLAKILERPGHEQAALLQLAIEGETNRAR